MTDCSTASTSPTASSSTSLTAPAAFRSSGPKTHVTGITAIDETTYRIDLATPPATGTYHVFVGPGVTDLAGNSMDQNADGVGGMLLSDTYAFSFEVDATTPTTPGQLSGRRRHGAVRRRPRHERHVPGDDLVSVD